MIGAIGLANSVSSTAHSAQRLPHQEVFRSIDANQDGAIDRQELRDLRQRAPEPREVNPRSHPEQDQPTRPYEGPVNTLPAALQSYAANFSESSESGLDLMV